MGNIRENKEEVYDWDESVYLIEEEDYVEGGEDGVSNRQATQLTRRTRDLFNRIADLLRKVVKGDSDTLASAKTYTDTTITATAATTLNSAKEYADIKVSSLVDSSPETLDTLNELAAALGDDPNFATTVANQIGTKVDKTDPRLSDARPANGGTANFLQWLLPDGGTYNNHYLKFVRTSPLGASSRLYLQADNVEFNTVEVSKADYADTAGSAPASDVYPWAKSATKPSYTSSEIGAIASGLNNREVDDCNRFIQNGMFGFADTPSNGPGPAFLSMLVVKNIETGYQLAGGYNSGNLYFRGIVTNGSFTPWKTIAFINDIPSALPANDVHQWAKSATKPSYDVSEITNLNRPIITDDRTNLNNEPDTGNKIWFDYNFAGTNNAGSVISFSGLNGGYNVQIFGTYLSSELYFRTRYGDINTWNPARKIYHSGNFDPTTKADKTDLEGYTKCLCAGVVKADGGRDRWKYKVFSARRIDTGYYEVDHDLGHMNYEVQLTAISREYGPMYASVFMKQDNSILVNTANDTELDDSSFFFQIFEF